MWNPIHETVYSIVVAYGSVTLPFLEEQAEWLGVSKKETDDCVSDMITSGVVCSPAPGRIQPRSI
jgi:hypothetical protein